MSVLAIEPVSGGTARQPRDVIELTARWTLATAPASLEARLFWFTGGKGTEDVAIVATDRIATTDAHGSRCVRFTLPEAPYSFSGKLITLTWAVELVAGHQAARWEFVMAPGGVEVGLGSPAEAGAGPVSA